ARPELNRPARPVDHLIVLLQPEIGPRFPVVYIQQLWTARVEPNRLAEYFQGLFISPQGGVIPTHTHHGVQIGWVQGERPFPLRDGLLEAPLLAENPGL